MRCTIDKAGRLVIPQDLRRHVGLAAGGEVDVYVDAAGIRIEPIPGEGLDTEDDLLVIPPSGTSIDDDIVRNMRYDDQR